MKTIENDQLLKLSANDWAQIHKTLSKRFRSFDRKNVVAIGYGEKRSSRKIEKGILSVRFHVRKKWLEGTAQAKGRSLIPKEIKVRVRQKNGTFKLIVLKSDVVEDSAIKPTAEFANYSSAKVCSTGVATSIDEGSTKRWGLLTVAHAFQGLSGFIDVAVNGHGATGVDVDGKITLKSAKDSGFDCAFIDVSEADLKKNGALNGPNPILMVSKAGLIACAKARQEGKILRPPPLGTVAFAITDYFPSRKLDHPAFPKKMNAIIRAEAKTAVFVDFTSGSPWTIDGQLAGIQIAAETSEKVGFAQAAFSIRKDWFVDLKKRAATFVSFY